MLENLFYFKEKDCGSVGILNKRPWTDLEDEKKINEEEMKVQFNIRQMAENKLNNTKYKKLPSSFHLGLESYKSLKKKIDLPKSEPIIQLALEEQKLLSSGNFLLFS